MGALGKPQRTYVPMIVESADWHCDHCRLTARYRFVCQTDESQGWMMCRSHAKQAVKSAEAVTPDVTGDKLVCACGDIGKTIDDIAYITDLVDGSRKTSDEIAALKFGGQS
ncbi:hypothetical protein [Leucobacter sp. OH1287]|uniref:hypothetical protein n=1 Tax=Leucobacter sp. OH1287 TaxID=2491049 RepID=UPI000F5DB2FC|nr:hypothetical protein [Leucobacter sp. OH1287]RRD61357.1 hypothetical protein EII30_02870 [Leucobacter sp. OH1287]